MNRALKNSKPIAPAIRCAVYTRKSNEDGLDQEFNSLDAQREAGEAYVASQKSEGWECLPERYDDGGFSGGNLERPALKRLLADIEAGKVDCIVVYKVDRLSRSLLDFARIMEVLDQRKVAFVSVTQQFNTSTPMGRLVLNVLLSFAQFEREIIGERIRDKIAAQRRKGKWAGGYPILGYDVDRSAVSPKLVVNAYEAHRVREIFSLYLSLGALMPVVDELAKRGWTNKEWTTKRGGRKGGRAFDKGSLYALLTNPLYVGKIKHKTDLFDGEHEAIVSPEVFEKVGATLRRNGRTGGAAVRNRYGAILKGLLVCKSCDRTMVHSFTGRASKMYRYYTCTQAIKRGRKSCPTKSLPAAEIERVVVDQIFAIADDAALRDEVWRQAKQHLEAESAELSTERRGLEKELARHHAELCTVAVDGAPKGALTARIADLHDHVARIETRLAELQLEAERRQGEQLAPADIEAAFADFRTVWDSLSPREQARLVALLVARVEFDVEESAIEITFHPAGIKALAEREMGAAA
jgi:site-specific DNA recombinase